MRPRLTARADWRVRLTNIAFTVREIAPDVSIVATPNSPASVDILEIAGADSVVHLGEILGAAMAARALGLSGDSHVIGVWDRGGFEIASAGTGLRDHRCSCSPVPPSSSRTSTTDTQSIRRPRRRPSSSEADEWAERSAPHSPVRASSTPSSNNPPNGNVTASAT